MTPGMWKNPAVTAAAGALAGILLGFAVGRFCAAECPAPSPATPLPSSTAVQDTAAPTGAELKRAADRALRDAGLHRGESAGVILQETLEDGSRMVSVRLENGRTVRGRLFRDRMRWKISLDPLTLYDGQTIVIEKELIHRKGR